MGKGTAASTLEQTLFSTFYSYPYFGVYCFKNVKITKISSKKIMLLQCALHTPNLIRPIGFSIMLCRRTAWVKLLFPSPKKHSLSPILPYTINQIPLRHHFLPAVGVLIIKKFRGIIKKVKNCGVCGLFSIPIHCHSLNASF